MTDRRAATGSVAAEVADEIRMLNQLAMQAEQDQMLARKRALADHHMKSQKRGRD